MVFVLTSGFYSLLFAPSIGSITFVTFVVIPLSALGFADDRLNLPVGLRYLVQIFTGPALIFLSPFPMPLAWLSIPFVLISITAVINFVNFMDGIDGLAAGCMAFSIAAVATLLSAPWPIWALVGSLLGFLIWNWSPAKIFYGRCTEYLFGCRFCRSCTSCLYLV